jgi:hypothetical protein
MYGQSLTRSAWSGFAPSGHFCFRVKQKCAGSREMDNRCTFVTFEPLHFSDARHLLDRTPSAAWIALA